MSYTKGNRKFQMSKESDKVKIFVGDRDDRKEVDNCVPL